ncbi:MAG: hypothetical protein GX575_29680 [Candidatus Anammoximicrobium sp.]|nr:hypothetical protein [Candidatus Anammoximicrobium sp.]
MDPRIQRRRFLGPVATGAAGLTVLRHSRSARGYWGNERLGLGLIEFLLLANVAALFGQTLKFDPLACKIVNHFEADAALRREYRAGWSS